MSKKRLKKLGEPEIQMWEFQQGLLSSEILYRDIIPAVEELIITREEKHSLISFIMMLLSEVTYDLWMGKESNPVHHSLQVLHSMLRLIVHDIGHVYKLSEVEVLTAAALLHDIGNAYVPPHIAKVKESKIKTKKAEGAPEGEIRRLVEQAILFRKEHMRLGAEFAEPILGKRFSSLETEMICSAIKVHDNPSNAWLVHRYENNLERKDDDSVTKYLFRGDANDITVILREVDRLWMISFAGLTKDLIDTLRKIKAEGRKIETCEGQALRKAYHDKLLHNIVRFREERDTYDAYTDHGAPFYRDTFFRNPGGIWLFQQFLREWASFEEMWENDEVKTVFEEYLGMKPSRNERRQ